ncbi:hypothetical protein BCR33DRAFT_433491 [Rhizoclosmatium globosum]|uniref:Uncharacterized protein n=1 Tax=Rhizoclosmatium globosum TaxID=329046 RepID=A0A1Y2BTR8_9FUNG|nr:hypothetical protein BCR33DRAFT_433491 [Rhizoclosmatium globosum]|eukprot:ORY38160.1 hypothetical protein BCR33DRAFT_433491 [Rhizoclosmatium globosum]
MKTPRRTSTPLPNTGSEEQSAPPFPPLSLSSNAPNPTSSGFDLWNDSDDDNEPSRISSQSQLSQSQTLEDLSCLNLDESGTKEQANDWKSPTTTSGSETMKPSDCQTNNNNNHLLYRNHN